MQLSHIPVSPIAQKIIMFVKDTDCDILLLIHSYFFRQGARERKQRSLLGKICRKQKQRQQFGSWRYYLLVIWFHAISHVSIIGCFFAFPTHLNVLPSVLQMKIEKKRSSSMDRILGKLRSAQKKAQDMRTTVSVSEDHCGVNEDQICVRATKKSSSYLGRTGKPFSCCFSYHAC